MRGGQHWNGGIEYLGYARWLDARDTADLVIEGSRRFTGAADLIDAGLLEPLDWGRSNGRLRLRRVVRSIWDRRR